MVSPLRRAAAPGAVATGVAVLGAVVVMAGAALVISGTTGFLLAGLVESVGFGLLGLWLIQLNRSTTSAPWWTPRLRNLGVVAGIAVALGLVAIPGVIMGVDNADTAPGWVWIGYLGRFGVYALFPIWSIRLGRALRTARA